MTLFLFRNAYKSRMTQPESVYVKSTYILIIKQRDPVSDMNTKKVRKSSVNDIAWVYKQQECFAKWPGQFYIKKGQHAFGACLSRDDFIRVWCTDDDYTKGLDIYELITCGAARLYFDLEGIYELNHPEALKAWLTTTIDAIQTCLKAIGVSDDQCKSFVVSNNCRGTAKGFKRSFHLTFDKIVFPDNNTLMKRFVLESVLPEIRTHRSLRWVSERKSGESIEYCVDPGVYTKNRAFRVAYASKDAGGRGLLPWDVDAWRELDFATAVDRMAWVQRSLCTTDTQSPTITSLPVSAGTLSFQPVPPVPPVDTAPLPSSVAPMAVDVCPDDELELFVEHAPDDRVKARLLVGLLSTARATTHGTWQSVVWAIAKIFDQDIEGKRLAHCFSIHAASYDGGAVDRLYYRNIPDVCPGFGSLVQWAREDTPAAAEVIVRPPPAPVPSTAGALPTGTFDESHIYQLADTFNRICRLEGWDNDKLERENAAVKLRIVQYINQWFCIVNRSTGHPAVIEEYMEAGSTSTYFVLRSPEDARAAYFGDCFILCDRKTRDGSYKSTEYTPMTVWLKHQARRKTNKIIFDPTPCQSFPATTFNLYRRPGVTPAESVEDIAAVQPLLDHIRMIWCRDNRVEYEYVLNWMAHLVQRPHVKMGCCLVVQGGQGTGKGCVIELLGKIIGDDYYIAVRNTDAVTGKFQMEKIKTNLFCFLDEVTFQGDKKQASMLKGLLTETTRHFEAKFVNGFTIQNFSNYIIASNYNRIVSVEVDDRRFVYLVTDNRFAGPQTPESEAHFAPLLVPGLHTKFAHFLYTRDISTFGPRKLPKTRHHQDAKARCFSASYAYIHQILQDGGVKRGETATSTCWFVPIPDREPVSVSREQLYELYTIYARGAQHKYSEVETDRDFYKTLGKLTGGSTAKRGRRGEQSLHFVFPSLISARRAFMACVVDDAWEWDDKQ